MGHVLFDYKINTNKFNNHIISYQPKWMKKILRCTVQPLLNVLFIHCLIIFTVIQFQLTTDYSWSALDSFKRGGKSLPQVKLDRCYPFFPLIV